MSEHRARIDWNRGESGFDHESYPRQHSWSFEGGIVVQASAAPEFRGSADLVDPEEAFVASVASCHMLTFLALASKKRFVVDRYVDAAVGFLEKNDDGKLAVTRIVLDPQVTFGGEKRPTDADLERLHHQAHQHCFIANSVRTAITLASD